MKPLVQLKEALDRRLKAMRRIEKKLEEKIEPGAESTDSGKTVPGKAN